MKRFLTCALAAMAALAMGILLAGCGSAKAYTAIPLGGDLPDYELDGPAFGKEYTEFDVEDEFTYGCDYAKGYKCEDSNTPMIIVYRWATEGMTLEESMDADVASGDILSYEIGDYDSYGQIGSFCTGGDIKGNFYYISCLRFVDGNEFVEIDYLAATEEIVLGETGCAAYIPKGYTDMSSSETGVTSYTYDASYYKPDFWMINYAKDVSYEDYKKLNSSVWDNNNFPFTEEQFKKNMSIDESDWTFDMTSEYYALMGCTLVSSSVIAKDSASIMYDQVTYTDDGKTYTADVIYVIGNNKVSQVWLYSDLNPFPQYGPTFILGIHEK